LVHVTHFNQLMWDSGLTPTRVIEHGVTVPTAVRYRGERPRGLVVVNNLQKRSRRLGLDIYHMVRERIPLDLVGIGSEELGGLGSIPLADLPALEASYRFFFNPIRYTSLGLAVCEAMMVGLPVIGLATTEMATVIENGTSGFVDTDLDHLVRAMRDLLDNPDLARRLGEGARLTAQKRFDIQRFSADWDNAFRTAISLHADRASTPSAILGDQS
jgi:glycosyltransferase involved in cell wall biosynthesis